MTSFGVFLRGINVGGINIKMAELAKSLGKLPVSNVKTLLASGNVVLDSDLSQAELKSAIESALRDDFGYDAWVVILSPSQISSIVAACPYPADDKSAHSYITLSSNIESLDELEHACSELSDAEFVRLSPEALAWLAPVGGTLQSPISKLTAKARYKTSTTTRNLRTMIKVLDATGHAPS